MKRYDLVFIGHLGQADVIPFEGSPYVERGGPVFFGPLAASCLGKTMAVVTRIAGDGGDFIEPLKAAGIDLFLEPGHATQYRIVFPTPSVDERQILFVSGGGHFSIEDLPPLEPCLIHLGGLGIGEFPLEFMQALRSRGFRLSADMQSFVCQPDPKTGILNLEDIPEKKEILSLLDFVKADIKEAQALTGTDVLEDQALILEDWGCSEPVITSSGGALARHRGETSFARFTNRNVQGRMGRGDTFSGAYLAYRLDHSMSDSLRFAAALTSIKMESLGPFRGSLNDVLARMDDPSTSNDTI